MGKPELDHQPKALERRLREERNTIYLFFCVIELKVKFIQRVYPRQEW